MQQQRENTHQIDNNETNCALINDKLLQATAKTAKGWAKLKNQVYLHHAEYPWYVNRLFFKKRSLFYFKRALFFITDALSFS